MRGPCRVNLRFVRVAFASQTSWAGAYFAWIPTKDSDHSVTESLNLEE
jgi:hypothetical protein